MRVLVAHGNTKRLRSAVDLMREAGFEVIATPDGGDAFARFFEEEPGLVLCSAQLPGLSGVSFAAMIESQAPGTRVAILIDPEEPANLESAANVPTITEPLTLDGLRAAIPDLPERAPAPPTNDGQASYTTSGVFALAALKRFQRDNSILAVVDEPGLNRIAAMAKHELRMSDEQVIAEGGPGDGFYLVVEGQVRVMLAEKNNQEIARIGAGGFFGEMAMLSDRKRSASVWTVGETTLLFFDRDDFMPLLADYPTLREVLSGVALKRTEENLWRSLFEDDEVQRSIGSLSEPMEAPTVPAAPSPLTPPPTPPVDDTWNTLTPPGGLTPEVRAPSPDIEGPRLAHQERIEALEADHALELTRVRSSGRRHGALAGVVVGIVLGFGLGLHLSPDHASEPLSAVAYEPPGSVGAAMDVKATITAEKAAPPMDEGRAKAPDAEPELAGVPDGA
ncbi:MAG TPA: cyclic nucleotide-binding domain-containing protein, partial [Myxococcota bacterium]|nr:cyclic nucleotide-binding domain-containing protein [Myxococcota bacterium]